MDIEYSQTYTKYGCNIQAFNNEQLLVIDYQEEFEAHPKSGDFGSGCIFDCLSEAKSVASSILENTEYETVLEIPELVIKYKSS